MNFITHFKEGQEAKHIGLSTGISTFTKAIRGIKKRHIYTVAAAPKVGKSKFVNYAFIISPFEQALADNKLNDIEWIYFLFESDRVTTEYDFATYYFAFKYNILNFKYEGKLYPMCSDYLQGELFDNNEKLIPVSIEHKEMLKSIYDNRIKLLFGEFDENGIQLTKGKITVITERDNPTGIRNYLLAYAKQHGTFVFEKYITEENGKKVRKERITGYKEKVVDKKTIIVTDTMRKVKLERNFQLKQAVDKLSEYYVELRDWCNFTFVNIIHINRNLSAVDRLKFSGEWIYPTGDDLKDTGNLSEDSNMVITMFNPHDEKYGLEKHMGVILENYPHYRSIHIVESRKTECPLHIRVNMYGNVNMFTPLIL